MVQQVNVFATKYFDLSLNPDSYMAVRENPLLYTLPLLTSVHVQWHGHVCEHVCVHTYTGIHTHTT